MMVRVKGRPSERDTRKNVTVGVGTITLLVLSEQGQLDIDDLDLRMKSSPVTLTLDHCLLQTCLFLQDAFSPEKLSSSFLGVCLLLPFRSRLSMLVVVLMVILRSLLMTHEGYLPSFLETTCSDKRTAEKKTESTPHG
jgi:hypothetical protein